MLEYTTGNILEIEADYVVVPVNCVGRPGKGLAAEWARNAPSYAVNMYKRLCVDGAFLPGDVRIFNNSTYILAATKDHWIRPSRIEWIDKICENLFFLAVDQKWYGDNKKVIALPKLGCGNGLLNWRDVHECMVHHLSQSPTTFLICYNPLDAVMTRK